MTSELPEMRQQPVLASPTEASGKGMAAAPAGNRRLRIALCLCIIVFSWAGLSLLAHNPAKWAQDLTQDLFGAAILVTYFTLCAVLVFMARAAKPALFYVIMVTFVLATGVGVLEAGAALKLVHWRLVLERLAGDGSNFLWSYRLDPDLIFRRQPNDHWAGRPQSDIESGALMPASLQAPISFTYDRWGYRNASEIDQADVVLIGDSYVEGAYVSDRQTATRRLQEHLGQAVANLGVAGYGSLQELIVLQTDAPRLAPKVAFWFFFEGNDLYDDEEFENAMFSGPPAAADTAKDPQGLTAHHGWKKRSFTVNLLRRLRVLSSAILPARPPYQGHLTVTGHEDETVYFVNYADVSWSDWIAGRWEKTQETMRKAADFARENDTHLMFVFVPIKYRVYRPFVTFDPESAASSWETWPLDDHFAAFCRSADLPCLDLTPIFQAAIAQEGLLPYAGVDTHWSPDGHDLVARSLAAELSRRNWLERDLSSTPR